MDFSKMTFNPMDIPEGKTMVEHYPQLKRHKEFSINEPEADKILRVVMFAVDVNSPLFDIREYKERVEEAAILSGFRKHNSIVKRIIEGKNRLAEDMICRLFILLNNYTYELWYSKIVAFGEANYQLRRPVEGKDSIKKTETKLKVGELAETLRIDILKLELELFNDDAIRNKIKSASDDRMINYAELLAEDDTVI